MKILISENQLNVVLENQKVLNQILDKISHEGMDSLTFREKEFLDKFSKGQSPEDIGPDFNFKKGTFIEPSSSHLPFEFTFNESIETDEGIDYFGIINFAGREYVGAFVCDKDNKLQSIEFWLWGTDENEEENLLDVAEGLEQELKIFFEDDVLPVITNG